MLNAFQETDNLLHRSLTRGCYSSTLNSSLLERHNRKINKNEQQQVAGEV